MDIIRFIKPEERYIRSYWETFDRIAKEKKYLISHEAFPYESTAAFIRDAIFQGYPSLFVIDTQKDSCVGWCDVLPKGDAAGYLGMGLLPEYRDRGIGTRLLKEIIALSYACGYHKIELDVLKSNARAIHVYRSLGFLQTHLVSGGFTWRDTLIEEDVVQMALLLKVPKDEGEAQA